MPYNINMKPVPGTINFMGSSFSGADIKFLVHSRHPGILKRRKEAEKEQIFADIRKLAEERDKAEANYQDLVALNAPDFAQKWRDRVDSLDNDISSLQQQHEVLSEQEWKNTDGLIQLATVSSLSVQAYRGTKAVKALGFVGPKGFTSGGRTVAGSIVFAQFDEHALADFLAVPPSKWRHEDIDRPVINVDQLPPMTITAQFANEYGAISELTIYGIKIVDDGLVVSIEDIFTENTCTYVAMGYTPLLKRGDVGLTSSGGNLGLIVPTSASTLIRDLKNTDEEYKSFEEVLGVRRRDPYR